jgi:hypothetical protein
VVKNRTDIVLVFVIPAILSSHRQKKIVRTDLCPVRILASALSLLVLAEKTLLCVCCSNLLNNIEVILKMDAFDHRMKRRSGGHLTENLTTALSDALFVAMDFRLESLELDVGIP